MSQYESPFEQQTMERPKTSGLAITSLVLSLVGVIPCLGLLLAPIGVILGVIAAITVAGNPARKGAGLAIAGIIIGVLMVVGQIWGGSALWQKFVAPAMRGPDAALTAGFGGDIAAFKSEFHGDGATAGDAVATAFIGELRSRYGEYQSCTFDEAGSPRPSYGQATQVFPYVLRFESGSVSAEAEMIFVDQATGQLVMKWGHIEVIDPNLGDLRYPPAETPEGESEGESEAGTTGDVAGDEG